METIQILLDKSLLRSANQTARRYKTNRSALIRVALREHIRRLRIHELEEAERRAYERIPDNDEFAPLQRITTWPKD